MLDYFAGSQAFRYKVNTDIGFVRVTVNLSGGNKKTMNQALIQNVITNGHLD